MAIDYALLFAFARGLAKSLLDKLEILKGKYSIIVAILTDVSKMAAGFITGGVNIERPIIIPGWS